LFQFLHCKKETRSPLEAVTAIAAHENENPPRNIREQGAGKKRIALNATFDQVNAISSSEQTNDDEAIGTRADTPHFLF